MQKTKSGFTIVELLIVIVVIAILATISVVAYSGVQSRARDSQRLSNIKDIISSLGRYNTMNGRFPSPTAASGSWERSDQEVDENFMEYLAGYGFVNGTPVDPTNQSPYYYSYYRYGAGSYGCDASQGAFYVLGVRSFESSSGTHPASPGFDCSGRDWQNEYEWVTGDFERF